MDPHNLDCSEVISTEYRNLCQALGITLGQPVSRAFTQNPATDLLILNEMSDRDLINVCSTNRYVNNLCNNESFWMNRVLSTYGSQLGTGREIKDKYMPGDTTWKDYYLWLTGLLNQPKVAAVVAYEHGREDLKIMLGLVNAPDVPLKAFTKPLFLNDNLRGFLREADFGPADPNDPRGAPLNNFLLEVTEGITNSVNMTYLFNLYIRRHKLFHGYSFIPDDLMKKWLSGTFEQMRMKRDARGLPFDPNNIDLSAINTIRALNTLDQKKLSPTQLKLQSDQRIGKKLDAESKLVRNILRFYDI